MRVDDKIFNRLVLKATTRAGRSIDFLKRVFLSKTLSDFHFQGQKSRTFFSLETVQPTFFLRNPPGLGEMKRDRTNRKTRKQKFSAFYTGWKLNLNCPWGDGMGGTMACFVVAHFFLFKSWLFGNLKTTLILGPQSLEILHTKK